MTVVSWWTALAAVNLINVLAWGALALVVLRERSTLSREGRLRRRQLLLAGIFVAGCAFRAVFPRADVQRICLVDSWLSAVTVGRAVATAAELAFAAQWALLLRGVARRADGSLVGLLAGLVLPLVAMAEVFSWSAVLTTNYLGNVLEESTWSLVAALVSIGLLIAWRSRAGGPRLLAFALVTVAYFAFLLTVDVPMYAGRWAADEAAGRTYLSVREGLIDASTRWRVTVRWEDWATEIPWMSLYFSLGAWASLALVRFRTAADPDQRAPRPAAVVATAEPPAWAANWTTRAASRAGSSK